MFANQTTQSVTTACYEFVRPDTRGIQPLSDLEYKSRMCLAFHENRCSLADDEIAALRQWISGWNHPAREKHLMLGGAYETPRPNRLRRLSYLMVVIQELGIPRDRIHPADDWSRVTGVSSKDTAPADQIWLQLRGFPASWVRTQAATVFDQDRCDYL